LGEFKVQTALETCCHERMNYKDTKPYMSAFHAVDLLADFAALCLTDFIDCIGDTFAAGVLHSVSDQVQNLQNCFSTPNKNDQ
jgi:hypothetical protein